MEEVKTAREIQAALAQPFAPEDLEWRLQQVNEEKPWGLAVPYVTNRAIQNRLDEVVGPDNWYNDYRPWHGTGKKEAQLCGISIYFADRGQWITKWDGAEDSDIEPIKGGLSDSMKRAAVQWGIGRVLYNMDAVFVDVEKRGRSWIIAKKEQPKLDKAYLDTLQRLGLQPASAGGIQSLLTPKKAEGKPSAPSLTAKNDGASTAQQQKPVKAQQQKLPEQPPQTPDSHLAAEDPEYKVISAKVQEGMNSKSTHVVLEGPENKRVNAYARGARPELTPGVVLTGVRMNMRQQDTVVFYILEDYRIAQLPQAA